jgi:N,N'-diacetyllegionaminate synthase
VVTSPSIELAGRTIGAGEPPFVVAEAGVNHNGQPELALALVDAAADAGADAVNFQTFSADALATAQAPQAAYQRERATAGSQVDMLRGLELSADGLRAARDRARERGLVFMSTPFDLGALQLLIELEVRAFKIGSGDLTNVVLLRAVAAQGRPILLSTGMATLAEIDAAVGVVRRAGDPPLVLLQCTSAYPAAAADANLMAMEHMRQRYGVPIGFSDHTLGMGASIAAAALGAAIIEKHLTPDRTLPGPDHAASLPPAEFAALVSGVRDAHAALGDGGKAPTAGEAEMRLIVRRSLVVNRPLVAGQIISEGDLDAMRPATGISPLRLDEVVGRRAARDLPERVPLMPDDLDPALPA